MNTRIAYCSACDRDVEVVITDGPSHDGQANLHEAEVVCLDIGERCSGNLCPIGATSPMVMAARLVHNGLQNAGNPLVSLVCEQCDHVTSHLLIEPRHATCTECGATSERVLTHE